MKIRYHTTISSNHGNQVPGIFGALYMFTFQIQLVHGHPSFILLSLNILRYDAISQPKEKYGTGKEN
jgi:hypothetical protein